MKVAELLKEIMALDLPLDKFYILGEAALVLYGVKEETEEINLCICLKLFNILRQEKRIDFSVIEDKHPYKLDGKSNVKVITKNKGDFECYKFGDLNLEDIRKIKDKSYKMRYFLERYPNYPEF